MALYFEPGQSATTKLLAAGGHQRFRARIPSALTELDEGRLRLPSKGTKQPVTRSQSTDGAKSDEQHHPVDEVNVERMIRQSVTL